MQKDIDRYYSSSNQTVLNKALIFAKNNLNSNIYEIKVILSARKNNGI